MNPARLRGVLVSLAILLGGLVCADDPADARAIIDKAIQAVGGEAKLAKFKAQSWKEKGIYHGMGQPIPYTGSFAVDFPDKFRMEVDGVFTIVLNDNQGWMKNAMGTQELTKEQLKEQKEAHFGGWVSSLLPLKDKAFMLTTLGASKVGDKPVVGVKVAHKDHKDVRLFFDKATGVLVKSEQTVKSAEAGKDVLQEALFADHKVVAGVKMPTKITMKRDGKLFVEAEIIELKPVDKLEDKVFAKP